MSSPTQPLRSNSTTPYLAGLLLIFSTILLSKTEVVGQETLPQAWIELLEQWNESDASSTAVEEIEDLYLRYRESPIDLNDTVRMPLAEVFFITPFQSTALRTYIAQRGRLYTVDELLMVAGFDSVTVALLKPIAVATESGVHTTFRWSNLTHGRSYLLVGASGPIERARGYREGQYEGNAMRLYWRYRYVAGRHLTLQIAGDKDAGEALFSHTQQQGFDHYSATLLLNNVGRIRQLAIGNYNLQIGQGVTFWSGFAPYTTLGGMEYRAGRGVVEASAFAEYGYLTGVATTVAVGHRWDATLFWAYTSLDATIPARLSDSTIEGYPTAQSISLNGMHRTTTEREKKNQVYETAYGTHVTYHTSNLKIGATAYRMQLDHYIQPANYRYYYFRGHDNGNGGIDISYRLHNTVIYGEGGLSTNGKGGWLAGIERLMRTRSRVGLNLHRYDARYWNRYANAISMGGHTYNETAASLTASSLLPWRLQTDAVVSWCYYPEMRSSAYGPSHATDMRIRVGRQMTRRLHVAAQYRYRRQQRNVHEGNDYLLAAAVKQRVQADANYTAGDWQYSMRIVGTTYSHHNEETHGWMTHANIGWKPAGKPIEVAGRITYFDIDDQDANIYAVDQGLAFDNSGTFFNHRGLKYYLVLHCRLNNAWAIGLKYSLCHYTDGNTFGSGYNATDKSHQQYWHIQLRLQL